MFFIEGNNNARYVVKYDIEDDKYKITATDLVRVWTETMSPEEIIERCKELNPNVEAPPKSLLSRVLNFLQISDETTRANIVLNEGNMTIYVQNRTSGFLFRFKFVLALSDPVEFMEEVTQPLMLIMKELQARVTHLCDILKRKDVEIQQYKLEGAQICRKSVETQPFSKEEFEKQYLMKDSQQGQGSPINMLSPDLIQLWQAISLLQKPKSNEIKVDIKQEVDSKIKQEPISSDDSDGGINNHVTNCNVAETAEPKTAPLIKIERDSESNHKRDVEKRKKVLKRKLRL